MEPPKPGKRAEIIRNAPNPSTAAAEYDEYERLLSKRFARPRPRPPAGAAAPDAIAPDPDEDRLEELKKKLFGV